MTRKRRRLYVLLAGMACLGVAAALVLSAFSDSLVYFYSPSDVIAKQIGPDRRIRLGGLVEPGSVARQGATVDFRVTDGQHAIAVHYQGTLPDLFGEGQGVVAEGRLQHGRFEASTVLAKHDEKYMPPEVVDALKRAGQWNPVANEPARPR
jgi:cytochrome c-type biogenesis protein CcmE